MIITCPNCSMRYLVATSAIGDEGRDVRCANCNHQWFQEPKQAESPLQEEGVEQVEEASSASAPVLPDASERPVSAQAAEQEQQTTEENEGSSQEESEQSLADGQDVESQIDTDSIEEVSGTHEEEDTGGEDATKERC